MSTPCKGIGEFLRIDFPLVYRNSIILAAAYLLLIPAIRGISNLNNIQSVQCLAQSVSFAGIILFVPILRPEMVSALKEIVCTKPWMYLKTIVIRIVCSLLLAAFFIIIFACVMQVQGCRFPFWSFSGVTILYAGFMGLIGLVAAQLGNSTIPGYLTALGYWSACQMQVIQEKDIFYFFPIVNGQINNGKVFMLITVDIVLAFLVYILINKKI